MSSKKKTNEELIKQINVKTEFADKIYKKMTSERYGLTYCCPIELEKINIENSLCHWEDIKVEKLPEAFSKKMLVNPSSEACVPPGIYNPTTGLCDAAVESTTSTTFTFSDAIAAPNGDPTPVVPKYNFNYGRDCPIIFEAPVQQNGQAANPTILPEGAGQGNPFWMTEYDNGVQNNISLVNALMKEPPTSWPSNTTLSFSISVEVTTSGTYHVGLAADNHFGFSVNGTDIITLSQEDPMREMINIANGQPPNNTNENNLENINPEFRCNSRINWGGWGAYGFTRLFIYPVTLNEGCNILKLSGRNDSGEGGFGFIVWNNTRSEIINSTSRSDLTEIVASDTVTTFYDNIDVENPWLCEPPAQLYYGEPFSATCPGCRTETSTSTFQCPPGFTLNPETNICEGQIETCDTETLHIQVVNQNGDIMPYYDIIFDGANYTTDDEGKLTIVIEAASVNTDHIINLCECITTGGGCAEQEITITVTDPNVEECVYPDLPCSCTAPALLEIVMPDLLDSPQFITLNFQDVNLANSSNNIQSYVFEYRVVGTTEFTAVGVSKPSTGNIIKTGITSSPLTQYEFRIKTICEDEESTYSAIYTVTSPNSLVPEGLIAWYDFGDKSVLYQNTGGTTPVTASGQGVQHIKNKAVDVDRLGDFARLESGSTEGIFGIDVEGIGSVKFDNTVLKSSDSPGYGGVVDGTTFSNLANHEIHEFTMFTVIDSGVTLAATELAWILRPNGSSLVGIHAFYLADFDVTGDQNPIMISPDGLTPALQQDQVQGKTLFVFRGSINPTTTQPNQFFSRNVGALETSTIDPVYNERVASAPINVGNTQSYDVGELSFGSYNATAQGLNGSFEGKIYESIMYKRTLTNDELQGLVEYFRAKYSIVI